MSKQTDREKDMNRTMKAGLKERPWLEPFIEPGEQSLEPAERRWSEAVDIAVRELERLGIEVHRRARTAHGLETTMLVTGREKR